ncbi:MAG: hypothetical protein N2512_07480 [Armatimonadetes bacterium]|nr:hypothetical protein [Armatimonadota bacterium]
MRSWYWNSKAFRAAAVVMGSLLLAPLGMGQEQTLAPLELCSGDAYRLSTYEESAVLEIDLRCASGEWLSLRRTGGAPGWYGYNQPGREVSSAAVAPKVERQRRGDVEVVAVSCALADGVTHLAEYVARPEYCAVVSRISAATPPSDAHILRLAPRFDMDIARLPCYAFRDGDGVLHTGSIRSVAAQRPSYIGTETWGGPGCLVASLDPTRTYLAFFNPGAGPLVAFVFFHAKTLWRQAHHFLQVYTGGANLLYAGFLDTYSFGEPVAFGICARAGGDLAAFEAMLPEVLQDFDALVRSRVIAIPAVEAAAEASSRVDRCAGALGQRSPAGDWLGAWRLWYACRRGSDAVEAGDGRGAIAVLDLFAPVEKP